MVKWVMVGYAGCYGHTVNVHSQEWFSSEQTADRVYVIRQR